MIFMNNTSAFYSVFFLLKDIVVQFERLQRVQNCLARVVCKASRFSRSEPLLNFLHWLPVKYRIRFKLCTITLKALLFHQPTYISL